MICGDFLEQVWDYLAGDLPSGMVGEMKAHAASCPVCARELDMARGAREALVSPKALDYDGVKARVLQKVYENRVRPLPLRRSGWLRYAVPAMGAVAAGLVLTLAIWPSPTSAISLDDLANEHAHCVRGGQYMKYPYATPDEFARRAASETGLVVQRSVPASQCKFLRGGFCDLKGVRTAHAILSSEGGLVSRFSLKESCRTFLENGGLETMRRGLWRARVANNTVVLIEQEEGTCDVFMGDASFEIMVKIVDNG